MLGEKLLHERLTKFKPEPLVDYQHDPNKIYEKIAIAENDEVIDLAKINFLGMLNNESIQQAAEKTIRKYGVGTCGPRAFYGTTEVHLSLEEKLAEFLGAEDCIIYSYGFMAIASSIASYTNKRDIVFVDKEANGAVLYGLNISRSRIVYFDHNDPESFLKEAEKIASEEKGKKILRKFVIVEGISWRTGKLCFLPRFVEIAEMFKMRIFVEESYTLGILGKTGRGITEYFNIDIVKIDMTFGTIEGALGSIGGYCAGSQTVIEHQRLSGSGYIFSASLPTYLAQIVINAIDILDNKPKKLVKFAREFHKFLEKCKFDVISDPISPFKVFTIKESENRLILEEQIYKLCIEESVHIQQNEKGLLINLNVDLFKTNKMKKVYLTLEKAAALIK